MRQINSQRTERVNDQLGDCVSIARWMQVELLISLRAQTEETANGADGSKLPVVRGALRRALI
jgi:hypothetical protein